MMPNHLTEVCKIQNYKNKSSPKDSASDDSNQMYRNTNLVFDSTCLTTY